MASPTATPTVAPGGRPSVVIELPPDGATYSVGGTIRVHARAQDRAGINRIELSAGDVLVASRSTAGAVPLESFSTVLEWNPTAEGQVDLSAVAYRLDGTASAPATITISVVFAGSPPTGSPAASPTAVAAATPTASPSTTPATALAPTPTAAPRPTLPPFATPSPRPRPPREPTPPPPETPRPTPREDPTPEPPTAPPSPTVGPTEIDLLLTVNPNDVQGSWEVGVPRDVRVTVSNVGRRRAPPVTVRLRICAASGPCRDGGNVKTETVELARTGSDTRAVRITPLIEAPRVLRVRIVLPDGFVDVDPSSNRLTIPIDQPPGE